MRAPQVRTIIVLTLVALTTACGPNTYGIGQRNASQLQATTDADLCVGVSSPWRNQLMINEVNRRGLNCNTMEKLQANATPNTGSKSPSTATARNVSCPDVVVINLTKDQGKALEYLIEQKMHINGIACLVEIAAHEKFPLRGQTVVKYTIKMSFPSGYKTQCFNIRTDKFTGWDNWMTQSQTCNEMGYQLDPLGRPAHPGEVREFAGEDVI